MPSIGPAAESCIGGLCDQGDEVSDGTRPHIAGATGGVGEKRRPIDRLRRMLQKLGRGSYG